MPADLLVPSAPPRRARALAEYRPFPNEEGRNSRQQSLEIPIMVAALGLPRGGRVLEVGCGRGVGLVTLAERLAPSRLVGLDIDVSLLDEAQRRVTAAGARAELRPGDVRELPFDDASFDLVVDFGTCYHIARPDAALREIARVLGPGGTFVEETPLSQMLSHPVRSFGRRVPWAAEPRLRRRRAAVLWSSHRRVGPQ